MLKELIGAQLISMDNSGFTVRLPNKEIRCFDFCSDDGDCCGYAEIAGKMLYKPRSKKNPIITNVIIESMDDNGIVKVNFFGEDKLIATIESEAGSGSGWAYGASAWVFCRETKETETLAEW